MTPPTPLRFTLLAALGVLQGCPSGTFGSGPDPDPALEQAEGLAAEKDWRRCLAVWREASEAAFGDDPHPFDEEGRAELLEQLEDSRGLVKRLGRRGLISDAEAGLLDADITTLRSGVQAKRPIELQAATCYSPMPYRPRQDALESLEPRVALLEGLAAQERLQPEVTTRVLVQVRADLSQLRAAEGENLDPDAQMRADEVAQRIEAALTALDRHSGPSQDDPGQSAPQPEGGEATIPEASPGE